MILPIATSRVTTALKSSLYRGHYPVEKLLPKRLEAKILRDIPAGKLAPQTSPYGVTVQLPFSQIDLVNEFRGDLIFAWRRRRGRCLGDFG